MAHKIQILAGDRQHISALLNQPAKKEKKDADERTLAIMIHGFPGHKAGNNDLFGDIEHQLVQKGFHTLRFDFRCCGESDGMEENFTLASASEDIQSVLSWARSKGYKNFIFIGEGLGATICALNIELDVSVMVLLWPVFDTPSIYERDFSGQPLNTEIKKKGYILHEDHKFGLDLIKELKNTLLPHTLTDVFMPTLILHGALDKKVPIEQLEIAREHMRSKRIEITTFHDGEHGLQKMNHRKMVFHHITQFIQKYT